MDWTSGYTAEIDYTHGHYGELSPSLINFALLLAGVMPPKAEKPTYLELGFGQGLSVNIHAATHNGEFWGTDMNPAHAANAQSLALAAGSGARLYDQSFEELAQRDDLPQFDYIVLHGIWSWVGEAAQAAICDIIRDRLKVGGAVYVSYNALPGWAPIMPVRHLLSLFAETGAGDSQGVFGRAEAAFAFAQSLPDAGARYFAANPVAKTRLDSIAKQNRTYVIHEYLNRHWSPANFSEVEARMASAKMRFAASASILDHVPHLNLTPDQQKILNGIGQPVLRETVRDYMVNQQFRRDIYVRGPRKLTVTEQREHLDAYHFALVVPAADVPRTLVTSLGELTLKLEVYEPLVAALAENDHRPKRLSDLSRDTAMKDMMSGSLIEALTVLIGAGAVHPVANPDPDGGLISRARQLSQHLIARSRSTGDVQHLPSAVTGGGVAVSRFDQLFLLHRAKGKKTPQSWAEDAWQDIKRQGQRLVKDGAVLEDDTANLTELTSQAVAMAERRLSIYRTLGLID